MTFEEVTEYIDSIPKFTKKNSPESTKQFYERLGRPGEKSKIIHVAGTNGKGSVCAYLNAILMEAGYTTGLFTSPHLVTILERFRINGIYVQEETYIAAFQQVMREVHIWNAEMGEQKNSYHPTFFEILFFIGMLLFEEKKVDYIILETGLGGRLDATNVIAHPVATIITKIGMDHMEYLGDTIEQITGEKAGIIKPGIPVIYVKQQENVTGIIEETAKLQRSSTFPLDSNAFIILKNTDKSIDFSFESKYYGYIRLTLSTCALYQCVNVQLTIQALEVIDKAKTIKKEHLLRAVAQTKWEGRMEEVLPRVYVDGAHNEDGMEAFMETVRAIPKVGNNHLLFAVVNDKDYSSMVQTLMQENLFDRVAITRIPGSRELKPEILEKIFSKYMDVSKVSLYEDVETAFQECLSKKEEQERLYIVGSLYLVGFIKEILGRQVHND
ncbi:MAG: bifunctional folylpolyglutamate synthase/dihydrofolate synthase [Lachnospiraceae bacterium]|nr:bifunctional folylpolyglutamate synthase/dihydrofolate synthase [Lachnospiraceae bacterium]